MKSKKILVFITAVVLIIIAIIFFSNDLFSPYVTFAEAMKNNGRYVQIIGTLDKRKSVQYRDGHLYFDVSDETNTRISVNFAGNKPVNFEHADKVVLLGRYDQAGTVFRADKLLVKCPSKYEKRIKDKSE